MAILTLLIVSLILVFFNTTRLFAIVILFLLTYTYPMLLFLIMGLCGSYFLHIRTHHEHLFLSIVNTDSYRT